MFISPINGFKTTTYHQNVKKYPQNSYSYGVSFKGNQDYFDYEKHLKEELDKRAWIEKVFSWGKGEARDRVNQMLIGFNLSQAAVIAAKNATLDEKEQRLKEAEEHKKTLIEKTNLLQEQLKIAQESHLKDDIIKDLRQKLQENQTKTDKVAENIETQKSEVDKLRKEQEILNRREAGKGWDKIAGYEVHKMTVGEAFINKIAQERAGLDVNMPNGILLYGQHGTGKTRFAQAFAEQAGCEFVKIDMLQDDDDIIMDLERELKLSKKRYNSPETPKKRTIILLDDFNSVAQINPFEKEAIENGSSDFSETNVGQLSKLLANCSDKYKATILMTTNHPRKIDSTLLNANLIPYQIYLGPPNASDAAKIFKYHLKGFTEQDIDYTLLGQKVIQSMAKNEAYSAQGIVNVVDNAKENTSDAQITEQDLLKAIEQVKPDITNKTYTAFLDDINEILETYYKNSTDEGK